MTKIQKDTYGLKSIATKSFLTFQITLIENKELNITTKNHDRNYNRMHCMPLCIDTLYKKIREITNTRD